MHEIINHFQKLYGCGNCVYSNKKLLNTGKPSCHYRSEIKIKKNKCLVKKEIINIEEN